MLFDIFLCAIAIASTAVTITEPVDGEVYSTDWLVLRAIVENENEIPESVCYTLNSQSPVDVFRLNTDWFTYMANDLHTGFSDSPAPTDNTILWTAPITGDTHEFCSPVVVNGVVYFVSDEQSVAYALDAATGDIIWQYDVVNHVDDAVTVYGDNVYLAADSAWCLDALTGDRIWASTGCLTLHGSRLYVPTHLGGLYALDISDGSIIWENSDSPSGYWDSSPVVVEDVIYICGNDGIARGIESVTGNTLWTREITAGVYYIAATPAYAYGELFFADQVDSFHCLSASSGDPVWSVPGVQHGSSGIANGMVFYGEGADRNYGRIVALSCETGEEIWYYQTGGTDIYSSPAITDGVVYIAGMDWNLYAFGTGFKYTYLDELLAQEGLNELIVSSFSGGMPVAADTISFTITGTGISPAPSRLLELTVTPNPFVSAASISFELSEPGFTSVAIYDLAGRIVCVLAEDGMPAGKHSVQWNGVNDSGVPVSPGLYFCGIRSGGTFETASICLL